MKEKVSQWSGRFLCSDLWRLSSERAHGKLPLGSERGSETGGDSIFLITKACIVTWFLLLLWDRYSQADALKYVGIERETDVL